MISGEDYKVSKILKVAFQVLLEVEQRVRITCNNQISDEDLLILHSIFGPIVERALNIFERYPTFETYSTPNTTRTLVEVKGDNDRCYRIFPRVNYCPCLAFKHQVVVAKSQVTCKHVLAARLAIILGKTVNHEVTQDQYRMLVNSMFEIRS